MFFKKNAQFTLLSRMTLDFIIASNLAYLCISAFYFFYTIVYILNIPPYT